MNTTTTAGAEQIRKRSVDTGRAARMLGRDKSSITAYCRRGLFPNAWRDGVGARALWRIPPEDIFALKAQEQKEADELTQRKAEKALKRQKALKLKRARAVTAELRDVSAEPPLPFTAETEPEPCLVAGATSTMTGLAEADRKVMVNLTGALHRLSGTLQACDRAEKARLGINMAELLDLRKDLQTLTQTQTLFAQRAVELERWLAETLGDVSTTPSAPATPALAAAA